MKSLIKEKQRLVKIVNAKRIKDGVSVKQLAKLAEMDQSNLNRALNKNYNISLDRICLLLNALGVQVSLNLVTGGKTKEISIGLKR